MIIINSKTIEDAVYQMCINANTHFSSAYYEKVLSLFNNANTSFDALKYKNILNNAYFASKTLRPLCQDTGQVIVFVELGSNVFIDGDDLTTTINKAVSRCYTDNYYRKSVVNNAIFDRNNSGDNTPVIIYTDIVKGNKINLKLLIKGAGSENYGSVKMFNPTVSHIEIFSFIKNCLTVAGEKACPPYVLGIGIGGTMDYATVLSKKAFFEKGVNNQEASFIAELFEYLLVNGLPVLDIKLKSTSTHIASLPVALTINCHSIRHCECSIIEGNVFINKNNSPNYALLDDSIFDNPKHIKTDDFVEIRQLQKGELVFLSGYVYTARDAAHKLLNDYFENGKKLPFDFKDKIIFYAGPCPATANEIIGPVGPTTSARMDAFCKLAYSQGLLASIGKGERSDEACNVIKSYNGKYFSIQGGIACLLAQCVKSSKIIAFEDMGTEAIRELYVENLPVVVEI